MLKCGQIRPFYIVPVHSAILACTSTWL